MAGRDVILSGPMGFCRDKIYDEIPFLEARRYTRGSRVGGGMLILFVHVGCGSKVVDDGREW